jgi:outer membrane protein TolC
MCRSRIVPAIMAFLLFIPALNGSGAERQVGLAEAVTMALKDYHEMRALKNSVLAQQEEVEVARSFLLPRLSLEERALRTNNPTLVFSSKLNEGRFSAEDLNINALNNPGPTSDFQTLVTFEQPIFQRKAFVGLDMAQKEYAALQEDYLRKSETTALTVAQMYLQVRTAKETLAVARQAVEDAREHLRIADLRFTNGLGLYSDTLRGRTRVTEAEQKVVSANKNFVLAKRSLGLLLGLEDPVDIQEEIPDFVIQDLAYYTAASQARRDLKALKIRWENAKNGIKLADSGYFPTLSLGGAYQLNDSNQPFGSSGESWQVMATLRWDLFDGANRESKRKKAHYQAAETAEQLNGLKRFISFRITEAYLAVDEAGKNADLSRSAVRTAEEGRRLVMARFENALAPLVDLLDVQLSLDQARANRVMRENEFRLAIIRLSFESGTIIQDLNLER